MQFSTRVSACRRELNSLDAAKPRKDGHLQRLFDLMEFDEPTLAKSQIISRVNTDRKGIVQPWRIERLHCVGCTGFQSGRWAAASICLFTDAGLSRRLEYVAHQLRQRGAGKSCGTSSRIAPPWLVRLHSRFSAALPNPSLKLSPNGVSRRPSSAGPAAHFALAVQRATPSVPA